MVMMQPLVYMFEHELQSHRQEIALLAKTPEQLESKFAHPVQVLDELAHRLKMDTCSLQRRFGERLFEYIQYENDPSSLTMADDYELFRDHQTPLLMEISKLYEHHRPPHFTIVQWQPPQQIIIDYQSSLPFAYVCHGFLSAYCRDLNHDVTIHLQLLDGALNHARYTIEQRLS